jgi:hypothetical protein
MADVVTIGGGESTFFIEDHMVTSRCLFFMGLSLERWTVVSLTFSMYRLIKYQVKKIVDVKIQPLIAII